MCKEHHWKISLDSEIGRGTTIEIVMPPIKTADKNNKSSQYQPVKADN
jgi:hypothetical protein